MQANEEFIKKRFLELARRAAEQYTYTYTSFLSLSELSLFSELQTKLPDVGFTLYGGHPEAERKLVRFGSPGLFGYDEPFPIACLCVSPASERFADDLTHRDFLGALLSLGIRRETLGDIFLKGSTAYVFCLNAVAEHILGELLSVKRTSVRVKKVDALPEALAPRLEQEEINIASERLDAIIAAAYRLSRAQSLELFRLKRVYVNNALMERSSHTPQSGDIISVRGFGRFRYDGVERLSRKGRSFATIQKYV